jgi:hypothetical protein
MGFEDVLTAVDAGAGIIGLVLFYRAHIRALTAIERLSGCEEECDSEKMST